MSDFMERAEAEAERRACRRAFLAGVRWALDQEPSDVEVDAAAEELHAQILVTDYADAEFMTREAMRSDALRILRTAAEARRGDQE